MVLKFQAQPTSRLKLRQEAKLYRKQFGCENGWFDIVGFLEWFLLDKGVDIEIVEDSEMEIGCESLTYPDEKTIKIPQSVYVAAVDGDCRARFTLAHELGHLLKHKEMTGGVFARGNDSIPAYRDPEWQANTFAAELLSPADLVKGMSIEEIVEKFGVSHECAYIQYQQSFKI